MRFECDGIRGVRGNNDGDDGGGGGGGASLVRGNGSIAAGRFRGVVHGGGLAGVEE